MRDNDRYDAIGMLKRAVEATPAIDITKLCDELEAELKAIKSMPVEDRSFAMYECRRKLFYAAQPLIDAARESAKLRATVKYYEDSLCFPLIPARWLDEGVSANEIRPQRVADLFSERDKLRERIKELEHELKERGG